MNGRRLVLTLFAAALAGPVHAGDLTVRIRGFAEVVGAVRIALFDDAADYEADRSLDGRIVELESDTVEVVFTGLAPGTYGVSSFHDANANGELDTSFVGMPTEAYGFSNDARGRFGPPDFDAMAFEVGEGDRTIEIKVE